MFLHVYAKCVKVTSEVKYGHSSFGAGVTGGYVPPKMGAENLKGLALILIGTGLS